MNKAKENGPMVTYQFEIDDDEWLEWKNTVPRSVSLDERIRELIRADTHGRVVEKNDESERETVSEGHIETQKPTPDVDKDALRDALAGSGDVLEARVDAILAMYEYLREHGSAEKSELLDAIDVESTRYDGRESAWANMVKGRDSLRVLPGVEPPSSGMSTWRYSK